MPSLRTPRITQIRYFTRIPRDFLCRHEDDPEKSGPCLTKLFRASSSDDLAGAGLLDEHLVPTHREVVEDQSRIRQVADVDTAVTAVRSRGTVVVGTEACRVVEPDVGREDREVGHVRLVQVGVPVRDLGPDAERTSRGVLVDPLADLLVVRVPAGPRLDGADETCVPEEVDPCDVADEWGAAAAHLVNDRDRPALAPARAEARDDLGVRLGVGGDVRLSLGLCDAIGDESPELLILDHGCLGAGAVAAVRSEATTWDASDAQCVLELLDGRALHAVAKRRQGSRAGFGREHDGSQNRYECAGSAEHDGSTSHDRVAVVVGEVRHCISLSLDVGVKQCHM